ncbi:MAG: copper amine oxidase N-terminal domain-containing protein [Bacillota bacterium]
MLFRRIGRLALSLTLLVALGLPTVARAETTAPAQPQTATEQDFSAPPNGFVYISLGATNDEQGIRLIEGQPDGLSAAAPKGGRRALANAVGPDRFLYFDVHDTYIKGGFNQVIMTVLYEDVGLTPIDLEYDAYDVINPDNMADAWIKKRVSVAVRTNSGGLKTARVVLDDARFAGNQPGGADFRLVTTDDLTVHNVSVMRAFGPRNLPVRVMVDGQEVIFEDVAPFINPETNSTVVPMRKLFNALGVPNHAIRWDDATRTVTAQKGETTIVLTIDSKVARVGSQMVQLTQPAIIKDGRTLIPLRFVSENLGLKVHWNPESHLITITSPPPPSPTQP